jgi:hypothetical protein
LFSTPICWLTSLLCALLGKGNNSIAHCVSEPRSPTAVQRGRKHVCYNIICICVAALFLHNVTIYNFSSTSLRVMDCAIPTASTMDQSTQTGGSLVHHSYFCIYYYLACYGSTKCISVDQQPTKQSTSQLNVLSPTIELDWAIATAVLGLNHEPLHRRSWQDCWNLYNYYYIFHLTFIKKLTRHVS